VAIASGAHLAPGNSIGTLTIDGSLDLAKGSVLDFEFGAPGGSFSVPGAGDSVAVGGNLTLSGATLNVTDTGGMGAGLYRLFSYGGTLTQSNGGIALGSVPAGGSLSLQYLAASKQVNLINTAGLTLNYWNGNGLANASQMGGGDGTWSTTQPSWTDATGSVTSVMQPQPAFAIFGGAAGNVVVDKSAGAVSATGMQFASDGYRLSGDTITLVATKASPGPVEVRVGDGSAASAGWSASIANVIAGTDGLQKTGDGTLELTGANTYTGGTLVKAGTLSVASDAALGNASGALTLDGGALKVTGSTFSTLSRGVTLGSGGGTFDVDSAVQHAGGDVRRGRRRCAGEVRRRDADAGLREHLRGRHVVNGGTLNAMVSGALGTGPVAVNGGGGLVFRGTADAGNLSIAMAARDGTINGGYVQFKDKASAGSATLVTATDANVTFADNSTAGNAVIENRGGGTTVWNNATAGKARITNFAGGHTDSWTTAPQGRPRWSMQLAAWSTSSTRHCRAGHGGQQGRRHGAHPRADRRRHVDRLAVGRGQRAPRRQGADHGGLNTDTEVSGVISGVGGSIVKVGTGALTLSGANTYTGGTALHEGRLNVGHSQALGTGALSMDDDTTLGFSADGACIANAIQLTGQNDPVIDTGAFSATLAARSAAAASSPSKARAR
jgi:fibronectin-binding autotransporter adhesin